MIGVISKESEKAIVSEFFELFKVPWEFYNDHQYYPVVLSTRDAIKELDTKLLILCNSEKVSFDTENKIGVVPQRNRGIYECNGFRVPLYEKMSLFDKAPNATTVMRGTAGTPIGIEVVGNGRKVIRLGFDLFQEVRYLLTTGQSSEFSLFPTLDAHISILRKCILDSGIPLVEIPPVPAGYDFTCCMTHDIDFAGIKNHKFDHTFFGFLYRALFGSMQGAFRQDRQWSRRLLENWKAVFSLPAVYAGLAEDFWMAFTRYRQIEEGFRSTYFVIPFKDRTGKAGPNHKHVRRAARYDVADIRNEIQGLLAHGCEIAVHGIDAWCDTENGRKEFERIRDVSKASEMGIRMHWLYFNDRSPRCLEDAGFIYDSSVGYNDAVGYRAGTVQVFRPIGSKCLLELPLHIQDTALFFPDRLALTEENAWPLISILMGNAEKYGGVLTVNWHDRSLAPERLWGHTYGKIVERLRKSNAYVDTAARVVRWFRKRRSASFEKVSMMRDKIALRVTCQHDEDVPGLTVRVYDPGAGGRNPLNILLTQNLDTEMPLCPDARAAGRRQDLMQRGLFSE